MYVWRMYLEDVERKSYHELLIALNGDVMALFANIHRGKNQTALTRDDFYRIGKQEHIIEERPLTEKEIKALLGSKFRGE